MKQQSVDSYSPLTFSIIYIHVICTCMYSATTTHHYVCMCMKTLYVHVYIIISCVFALYILYAIYVCIHIIYIRSCAFALYSLHVSCVKLVQLYGKQSSCSALTSALLQQLHSLSLPIFQSGLFSSLPQICIIYVLMYLSITKASIL